MSLILFNILYLFDFICIFIIKKLAAVKGRLSVGAQSEGSGNAAITASPLWSTKSGCWRDRLRSDMDTLNTQWFLWFNATTPPGPLQLWWTTLVAEWLIYGLPLLLALLWLAGKRPAREAAVTATLSVLLALACGQLIGLLWPHPRPFMIGLGQTLLAHQPESSFPSDHATVFFTLGISLLWSGWRKLASLVLLLGGLVAWSRLYLGVHFPLDMLGALLLAIPSAIITARALRYRQLGSRLVDALELCYAACLCRGKPSRPQE